MAERRRYLLTYDIRDARRLRRVHQAAKAFGYPLQYSVFVCDLDRSGRTQLIEGMLEAMHQGVDSVSLFDLGASDGRGVTCVRHLGRPGDVPPSGGAAVW